MSKKQETAALVKIGDEYPVLAGGDAAREMMELVKESLGDEEIGAMDLERVTVPAGGGLHWIVPSPDDPDGDSVKEIEGIIVYHRMGRVYWSTDLDEGGGGSPPDCWSDDGVVGLGTPGVDAKQRFDPRTNIMGYDCASCPNAQFGSAGGESRSQACQQRRLIFLMRPGDALPIVLQIPPTSLKPIKTMLLGMIRRRVPYYGCVVGLSLSKAQNRDGINYAQVSPRIIGSISPEDMAGLREWVETMRDTFAGVSVVPEAEDVETGDEAEA